MAWSRRNVILLYRWSLFLNAYRKPYSYVRGCCFFSTTCFRHYGHDCVNEVILFHNHLEWFTYAKLIKHRLEDHWIQSLFITLKSKCDTSLCNTDKYTSHKGIVLASFLLVGHLLIFWRRATTTWTSSTFWALVWFTARTGVDDPPYGFLSSANIAQGRR